MRQLKRVSFIITVIGYVWSNDYLVTNIGQLSVVNGGAYKGCRYFTLFRGDNNLYYILNAFKAT